MRSSAKIHVSFVLKLIPMSVSRVFLFGSCNDWKQETNGLCSYIARERQLPRSVVGILLAFWLTQAQRWISNA
jgi:hypothetical protein